MGDIRGIHFELKNGSETELLSLLYNETQEDMPAWITLSDHEQENNICFDVTELRRLAEILHRFADILEKP